MEFKPPRRSSKYEPYSPEWWEELDLMFEQTVGLISQEMTPDFSKEDWMELYRKSKEGDSTSVNLLMSLFERKGKRFLELQLRHMKGVPITDEEMDELIRIREDRK